MPNKLFAQVLAIVALCTAAVAARAQDVATWTASIAPASLKPGAKAVVTVNVAIQTGWHIYSVTQGPGGPFPTKIVVAPGGPLLGGKVQQPKPEIQFDKNFNINVEEFNGSASFTVPVTVGPKASGPSKATVNITFQACNESTCMPPKDVTLEVKFDVAGGKAPPGQGAVKPGNTKPAPPDAKGAATNPPPTNSTSSSAAGQSATKASPSGTTPAPSTSAYDAIPDGSNDATKAIDKGFLPFLWFSILAGFAALATPCVFPMIPITVSFFSKKREGATKRTGLGMAAAYCLGIVGTFTLLGIAVTAIFGAGGIQRLATNPWLNVGLATLFLVLAASLFGVFEVGLPSSLANRLQSGTRKDGFVGPLIMGLTFTLTSFTCTLPIVGALLAIAAKGSLLYPVVGMLAFSSAFALPFFVLALFPQVLHKIPKSGPWLASVKAFMGFVEIAAALKFLSNADLVFQAGILTRPVYVALWSMITIIAALYLLGLIKIPTVENPPRLGYARLALGVATLVGGFYVLRSIEGRSLGELEAFLPPSDYPGSGKIDNYETGIKLARERGKPLFIDFTGVTCTNCRWMEKNMFPRTEIADILKNFVTIQLYTDRQTPEDNANQKLQQKLTGTIVLPVYVVVSPEGKVLSSFPGLTREPQAFAAFLNHCLHPANGSVVAR